MYKHHLFYTHTPLPMQLHVINTGHFKLDGGAMFGVVPKQLWAKLNPPDDNNLCSWAMRCLLIQEGDYAVLIDNGIGTKQDAKFLSHYHLHGPDSLEKSLHTAGLDFGDITHNFLTHLHFDHCGGGIRYDEQGNAVPTFPRARYITNHAHWDWASKPNPRERASFLKENLLPMQELSLLDFVEGETLPFMPQVEIIKVHGHTEAQMLPLIHYKGHKILFAADLLPSAAHLPLAWVMAYDVRPLDTMAEREYILNRAATEGWVLFFEHDPTNECATVQHTDKGVRLKETFPLSALG